MDALERTGRPAAGIDAAEFVGACKQHGACDQRRELRSVARTTTPQQCEEV